MLLYAVRFNDVTNTHCSNGICVTPQRPFVYITHCIYAAKHCYTTLFSFTLCATYVCVCVRLLVCAPYTATTTDAPMRPLLLPSLPQPQLLGYSAVCVCVVCAP